MLNFFQGESGEFLAQISPKSSKKMDSLLKVINKGGEDTNIVNAYNGCAEILGKSNPDSSILLTKKGLKIARKIEWIKGQTTSEFYLGSFNSTLNRKQIAVEHYTRAFELSNKLRDSKYKNDIRSGSFLGARIKLFSSILFLHSAEYDAALENLYMGLKLAQESGDKFIVSQIYGRIAATYYFKSDHPNAIAFFLKALKLSEELGNKREACTILTNMSNVYINEKNYDQSLKHLYSALKLVEGTKNEDKLANIYGCIGNTYRLTQNYEKAMEFYLKSAEIFERIQDEKMLCNSYGNLGNTYKDLNQNKKALEFYIKGLELSNKQNDKMSMAIGLGNVGNIYTDLRNYKEAEVFLTRSLLLARELGAKMVEQEQEKRLSILYQNMGKHNEALFHYKRHVIVNDSIFNAENNKKLMRTEMDHEYEKKKAVADAEHKVQIENQKLIAAEKEKKQNIVIASVVAGLLLVIIFAGFIFRSLRITNKQKLIIEQKNAETEHQKKEIEEKQKEILDSIHYAKRIQMAQVPNEKRVQIMLNKLKK